MCGPEHSWQPGLCVPSSSLPGMPSPVGWMGEEEVGENTVHLDHFNEPSAMRRMHVLTSFNPQTISNRWEGEGGVVLTSAICMEKLSMV